MSSFAPRPAGGFTSLILAAGESARMGRPKAMLAIDRTPAWLRVARICLGAGASKVQILVTEELHRVLMSEPPLADASLGMVPLVVPPELRRHGPIGSIVHGIRTSPGSAGWLLWPVDHPFVAALTIETLVRAQGKIRVPRFRGRRGHPVFLEAACRDQLLLAAEGGATLRDFVSGHGDERKDVDVRDPAIRWNCNSPAAFRAWLEKHEAASRRR